MPKEDSIAVHKSPYWTKRSARKDRSGSEAETERVGAVEGRAGVEGGERLSISEDQHHISRMASKHGWNTRTLSSAFLSTSILVR